MKNVRFRSSFNLALASNSNGIMSFRRENRCNYFPLNIPIPEGFQDYISETCIFWVEVFCVGLNTLQQ
jgi:hypothetical protein